MLRLHVATELYDSKIYFYTVVLAFVCSEAVNNYMYMRHRLPCKYMYLDGNVLDNLVLPPKLLRKNRP